MSINRTPVKVDEWRLETDAKALTSSAQHDFSVVFDYSNELNYYFVNFSDQAGQYSNGVFKVDNGKQVLIAQLPTTIQAGKNYHIEIRKKGDQIKVYRDKSYQVRASGLKYASTLVGYGSRGGAAQFDNLVVRGSGSIKNPTPSPSPEPSPSPTTPSPSPTPTPGPTPTPTPDGGRQVNVTNASQLEMALSTAQAGDVINLADGTYTAKGNSVTVGKQNASAKFRINGKVGTAQKPIVIQGSRKAIIDGKPGGDGTGSDYGFHVFNSQYVYIKGIRIRNAAKGLILDNAQHNIIDGVEVDTVGAEAVHLRRFSSDNVIKNSTVHDTGMRQAQFGEAIYLGSANSNWGTISDGKPDTSDRNQVLNNTLYAFKAEGIDIKEGSSNGLIQGNTFNGSSLYGENSGDSWVDVKGNGYTLNANKGSRLNRVEKAKEDQAAAFQTHSLVTGWGNNNTFSNNVVDVSGVQIVTKDKSNADAEVLTPGSAYGFWFESKTSGNVAFCNNTVTNAGKGFANVPCKQ